MQDYTLPLLSQTQPSGKRLMANVAASLLLTVGTVTAFASNASAAFIGYYAPSNWTTTDFNSNGTVDISGAPDSIVVIGGDNQSGISGTTDFTIAAQESGTWSFSWSYDSFDNVGDADRGGYLLNGVFTQLAQNSDVENNGFQPVTGSVSLAVNQDDIIGYRVRTLDNNSFPGQLTVSNFNAPITGTVAVPYNFSPGLGLWVLGIGFGIGKVRKHLRSQKLSTSTLSDTNIQPELSQSNQSR